MRKLQRSMTVSRRWRKSRWSWFYRLWDQRRSVISKVSTLNLLLEYVRCGGISEKEVRVKVVNGWKRTVARSMMSVVQGGDRDFLWTWSESASLHFGNDSGKILQWLGRAYFLFFLIFDSLICYGCVLFLALVLFALFWSCFYGLQKLRE